MKESIQVHLKLTKLKLKNQPKDACGHFDIKTKLFSNGLT